jgi:hypothetical protein
MRTRWRGRSAGPAILSVATVAVATLAVTLTAATGRDDPVVVLRGPDDRVLAEIPLPDGEFTLRYRNSVYRSTAEERFAIGSDGRITLVVLAADELAVLEEYYAIDDPAEATGGESARAWEARPARAVVLDRLVVAATDLGRRTLLVEGRQPLELWRLVEDGAPSVELVVRFP